METSVTQVVPDTPSPKPCTDEATEFVVSRKELLEELTQIQGAVDRRATVPILSHILLQAAGNVLQLTATDLDISLRSACPAAVKKPGVCTIPGRKLFDYVKLLPDGELTIKTLENNWIQIRSGRSHTKMVALPRRNFPRLPLFPKESAMTLDADVLRNLIAKTIFAISKEESRYTLNGALLVLKPQSIAMVATDGHRLAQVEYKTPTTPAIQENEIRILIPYKALCRAGFTPDVITRRADPIRQGQHHLILCRLEVACLPPGSSWGRFRIMKPFCRGTTRTKWSSREKNSLWPSGASRNFLISDPTRYESAWERTS